MVNIIIKVRDLIQDSLKTDGRDIFTYESITSSKIFTPTEANISASTIIVYKNGTVWAGTNYSYSTTTGKLTVTGTLTVGDSLEVTYSYYQKYSDTELQGQIRSAISYLVVEKYRCFAVKPPDIIFPTPSENEENLIAVVASILIKGDVVGYRTPELTINFERGDSKEKKIKKFVRQYQKAYGYLTYIDPSETIVNEDDEVIEE
jgi:hypothetical protein